MIHFQPVGNITYSPCSVDVSYIVGDHCEKLKSMFNISIPNGDSKIPKLFWVPKLHKDPYKFRFIAGARNCTTKCLSVILNKGLTVIRSNFSAYCDSIRKNSGYNFFWSVKSSTEFLEKFNNVKHVFSVQGFDFSTLYTNLDQKQIISHLYSLLILPLILRPENICVLDGISHFLPKKSTTTIIVLILLSLRKPSISLYRKCTSPSLVKSSSKIVVFLWEETAVLCSLTCFWLTVNLFL